MLYTHAYTCTALLVIHFTCFRLSLCSSELKPGCTLTSSTAAHMLWYTCALNTCSCRRILVVVHIVCCTKVWTVSIGAHLYLFIFSILCSKFFRKMHKIFLQDSVVSLKKKSLVWFGWKYDTSVVWRYSFILLIITHGSGFYGFQPVNLNSPWLSETRWSQSVYTVMNRNGWIIYWSVSTWWWWRHVSFGGTTENPPTGTDPTVVLLPPPSSCLFVILRAPLRQAALSGEQSANPSLFSLISKGELEVKRNLCHFRTVSPNFQWEQTTGASLLRLFNPEPQSWTVGHLMRCACCSLDIYASRCCGLCNQERLRNKVSG